MSESEQTIFDKILNKEIHAETIYEDDLLDSLLNTNIYTTFKDNDPQAPIHYILIPKNKGELSQLRNASEKHKDILGHLMIVVSKIAQASIQLKNGYRIVVNDGEDACQAVQHLHIHILGGAKLSWPPGTPGPEANKKN